MANKLEALPSITKLSEVVTRVLGSNPGPFTLQGTNTYLVGRGPHRVLIDTGGGVDNYHKILVDYCNSQNLKITTILLTHWHHDHISGVPFIARAFDSPPRIFKGKSPSHKDSELAVNIEPFLTGYIHDQDEFGQHEGVKLRAYFTPGHTDDHFVFLLSDDTSSSEDHQESNITYTPSLFSGDNILGTGSAVFEELGIYMESLSKMEKLLASQGVNLSTEPIKIYPGHGPLIRDGPSKVSEYINHRKQREIQVLETLTRLQQRHENHPLGCTINQVVSEMYAGYPENVLAAAERNVLQHLEKLHLENRVNKSVQDDIFWTVIEDTQRHNL